MFKVTLGVLLLCAVCVAPAQAAEIDTTNALCPVAKSKAVNAAQSVGYQGAKVFFCCGNCKAAFEGDPTKFAARANHQLVVTGQAQQTACPFSGGDVNPEKTITVSKAEVGFCCGNCLGKAEGMETAAQIDAIFGAAAFKKGFEIKKQ